jgi:ABC-type Fe3+-siderophore transport system permease subunit
LPPSGLSGTVLFIGLATPKLGRLLVFPAAPGRRPNALMLLA